MANKRYVVDGSTGEYLTEMHDGDRILRKKSIDFLKDELEKDNTMYKTEYRHFTVTNDCEYECICKKLSIYEKALLSSVKSYVRFGSFLLAYANGIPLSAEDMQELIPAGRTKTLDTLKKLIDKRLIAKVVTGKTVKYYMNPVLCMKGNRVNQTIVSMFAKYKVKSCRGEYLENLVKNDRIVLE